MAGHNLETIAWVALDHTIGRSLMDRRVVAVRGDDKMYAGRAIEVTANDVVLASGNQRQVLQFHNYRYMVAVMDGPEPWTPRMAERKLSL